MRLDRPLLSEVRPLFRYDPDTGGLWWAVDRPPRVKAGDLAGTKTADGYVLVTLGRYKIPGHHLAWALHHGEWPQGRVIIKTSVDPDISEQEQRDMREDLRASSLITQEEVYVKNPTAARQRDYNRRQREYRASIRAAREARNVSDIEGVRYSLSDQKWVAWNIFDARPNTDDDKGPPIYSRVIGEFKTQAAAEKASLEFSANRTSLLEYPVPPTEPGDEILTAGPHGETLAWLNKVLCYDPDRGIFIWRLNPYENRDGPWPRAGATANKLNANRAQIVNWSGKHYPAHLLAWFMTYREWPDRRVMAFRDGDRTNIKLANLGKKAR